MSWRRQLSENIVCVLQLCRIPERKGKIKTGEADAASSNLYVVAGSCHAAPDMAAGSYSRARSISLSHHVCNGRKASSREQCQGSC